MSQSQVSAQDLSALIGQAQDQGAMDPNVASMTVANLNASAVALAAAQGETAELGATEVVIVVWVVDGSGSMEEAAKTVIESVNENTAAMAETKRASAITMTMVVFNDQVNLLFANQPIENVARIGQNDYRPGGRTALYDAVYDSVTGAVAYEEQLLNTGMSTWVDVCIFSDGANNASVRATAQMIKDFLTKLRRENWRVAFIGFHTYETDQGTDFKNIALGMGITPANIDEVDLTGTEYERKHKIRAKFGEVSRSSIRRSQGKVDPNAPAAFFDQV